MDRTHGEADISLAACRATFTALMRPEMSLGEAARSYGYKERSMLGDIFEHAWEWAKEERKLVSDCWPEVIASAIPLTDEQVKRLTLSPKGEARWKKLYES